MVKSKKYPPPYTIYTYTNNLQRTVTTTQFFITNTFPKYNIPIHHQKKINTINPTFNPIITNNSTTFNKQTITTIKKKLNKLQLTNNYQLLKKIINYKNSPTYKKKQQYSLINNKNTFNTKYQQKPNISKPLKINNSLINTFTLQYYKNFPINQIT